MEANQDRELSRFCCRNPGCEEYGKRGAGDLTVCGRYGEGGRFRLLYCRSCKARFSERKGTVLFNARLPEEKAVLVLGHLAEGCGVRQTGRLVGVSRETVGRYCRVAGGHASALHDELVAFSPSDEGSAVRRELGVRGQEAEEREGRSRRPRRR